MSFYEGSSFVNPLAFFGRLFFVHRLHCSGSIPQQPSDQFRSSSRTSVVGRFLVAFRLNDLRRPSIRVGERRSPNAAYAQGVQGNRFEKRPIYQRRLLDRWQPRTFTGAFTNLSCETPQYSL